MPVDILISGLLVIMLVGAIICLEVKDILSTIVIFAMVGLCLSLSFLILQAPDLALVQFIYEIVILGLAFVTMKALNPDGANMILAESVSRKVTAVIMLIFILSAGYFAMKELPVFGNHRLNVSEHYVTVGAKETGAANLTAAIALDYRVYDSFGEAIVIFTGILGGLTIIRKMGRNDHGE
jgi:multicomponent Na+:H+ antiporter subunit B